MWSWSFLLSAWLCLCKFASSLCWRESLDLKSGRLLSILFCLHHSLDRRGIYFDHVLVAALLWIQFNCIGARIENDATVAISELTLFINWLGFLDIKLKALTWVRVNILQRNTRKRVVLLKQAYLVVILNAALWRLLQRWTHLMTVYCHWSRWGASNSVAINLSLRSGHHDFALFLNSTMLRVQWTRMACSCPLSKISHVSCRQWCVCRSSSISVTSLLTG